MNPVIARIESLWEEGLPTSSVRVERRGPGSWSAVLSIAAYLPIGEGDGTCGKYVVTIEPPPPGVLVHGWERYPDQVVELSGSEEQVEAVIVEIAREGRALDWARFDSDAPSYPHFVVKPNRWLPESLGGGA